MARGQSAPLRPNKTDASNRRNGEWAIYFDGNWEEIASRELSVYYRLITYRDDLPQGLVTDHYANGIKQWEGNITKDRPDFYDGRQTWFYEDGKTKAEAVYKNNELVSSSSYLRNGEEANPNWENDYYNVARAAVDQNDYTTAYQFFNRALPHLEALSAKESEEYADVLEWISIVIKDPDASGEALRIEEELARIYHIIRKPGDVDMLKSMYRAARYYKNMAHFAEAEQILNAYFNEEKSGPTPFHEMHGLALSALADVYMETMRYREAVLILETALNYYTQHPPAEPLELELAKTHMMRARFLTGEWSEGKRFMLEELKKIKQAKGEESSAFLSALSALGNYSRMNGQLKEAEGYFLQIARIIEKNNITDLTVVVPGYIPLAEIYQQWGQPNRSAQYIQKGTDIFAKADKADPSYYLMYIPFLKRLIAYHTALGNKKENEQAIEELKQATKKTYGPQSPEFASSLSIHAEFLQMARRFNESIPELTEADMIMARFSSGQLSATDTRAYAKILQQLATGWYLSAIPVPHENVDKAEIFAAKSEVMYGRLPEQTFIPEVIDVYLTQAALKEFNGKEKEADDRYARCQQIILKHFGEDHAYYATILFSIAKKSEVRNDFKQSHTYYKKAIQKQNLYINRVLPYLSTEEKESFYRANAEWITNYQSFASLHIKDDPSLADELYDLQLSNKGVVFQSLNRIRRVVEEEGSADLKDLYDKWRKGKNDLVKAYHSALPGGLKDNDTWKQLEREVGELEKQISAQSNEFSQFLNQAQLSWKQIQQNLKSDDAAIEITSIPREINEDTIYVAMIVRKDDAHPVIVEIGEARTLEGKALKYYRNAALLHVEDKQSYNVYWKPLAAYLINIRRIFISSDGVYHQMNVSTFLNPEKNAYVFDELDVRVIPSTALLAKKSPGKKPVNKVILFAHPDYGVASKSMKPGDNLNRAFDLDKITDLPGTEKERVALTDILRLKNIPYQDFSGSDASEDNVKLLEEPAILHFATHGFFLSDLKSGANKEGEHYGFKAETLAENPLLRSGLLMAGCQQKSGEKNNEDGILTAFEASTLELYNTELVVLSACETGLGEVKNGEGVYGLQRAFAMAGARQIIMSLWKVDDEATQQFMTHFYQSYLDTRDAGESFRIAQKKIKDQYNSPYYWGAFVISGI
jgi:CHAT domain-containing protein